jgi:5'-nucleotidase / UDP-sugar diphosphatase
MAYTKGVMTRRTSGMLSFVVCLIGLLMPYTVLAQATLTILHTSEHHGALQAFESGPYAGQGGMARRATLIQDTRKEVEHVLLVDSGDLLIGTALSAMFRGIADIAAMNQMRYDALAVGNHDFDFGLDHLAKLRQQAKFPFLCTNLRPRQSNICQRVAFKTIGPLRIAMIGLVGKTNYPDTFNRDVVRGVEFQDPIEAARVALAEFREQAEVFVAITHQDSEEDLALAKALPALDVIIGGHTRGFDGLVPPGRTDPEEGRVELFGGGPIFVKTHRQGRTLGRLDLLYHERTIMVAEAQNILIGPSVTPDPPVSQLVQNYVNQLDRETNRVVGHAATDLEGDHHAIRTRETRLGHLLADLAREETGAEVALLNAGMIRGDIHAGPVTYKRLMEVLPFEAILTKLQLTGAELRGALENSVSQLPEASGRFLQVSGLRYAFDPRRPVGSRIADVRVQGHPLVLDRRYSVVVPRFLAEGGDGYQIFLQAQGKRDYDVPLRDLLATALMRVPLTIPSDVRIESVLSP